MKNYQEINIANWNFEELNNYLLLTLFDAPKIDFIKNVVRIYNPFLQRAYFVFVYQYKGNTYIYLNKNLAPFITDCIQNKTLILQVYENNLFQQLKKKKWICYWNKNYIGLLLNLIQNKLLQFHIFANNFQEIKDDFVVGTSLLASKLLNEKEIVNHKDANFLLIGSYHQLKIWEEFFWKNKITNVQILNLNYWTCGIGICNGCSIKIKNNLMLKPCLKPFYNLNEIDYEWILGDLDKDNLSL